MQGMLEDQVGHGKFIVVVRHLDSNREESFMIDIMEGDPVEKLTQLVTTMHGLVTGTHKDKYESE